MKENLKTLKNLGTHGPKPTKIDARMRKITKCRQHFENAASNASRRLQDASKTRQDGSNRLRDAPRHRPYDGYAQLAQALQQGSQQGGPKTPQDVPGTTQDAPKLRSRSQ